VSVPGDFIQAESTVLSIEIFIEIEIEVFISIEIEIFISIPVS